MENDAISRDEQTSYESLVEALSSQRPILGSNLGIAQSNRRNRLALYLTGKRLEGLELSLRLLTEGYKLNADDSTPLAFLIDRAASDITTATEGLLSGYQTVVADTMRDLSEISLLFKHFAHEPSLIDHWFRCDERERKRAYGPHKLRIAQARRLAMDVRDLPDSIDYAAHSQLLHVTPIQSSLILHRGVSTDHTGLNGEYAFWEIYPHVRQLLENLSSFLETTRQMTLEHIDSKAWQGFIACCDRVSLSRWCMEVTCAAASGKPEPEISADPQVIETAFHNANIIHEALEMMSNLRSWNLTRREWSIFFEAIARSVQVGERLTVEAAVSNFVNRIANMPKDRLPD